jgi:SAM-dependent MidA family methyltransferase
MARNDTGMPLTGVPMAPEAPLSEVELAQVRAAGEHIRARIRERGGWLPFERFMDLALYAPGLGYYSAGAHKLGEGGDFTTAPEISRLFGGCVAEQCAAVLDALGGGSILEIGAGSGALAADILSRLEELDRPPARYFILEVSADLRERQSRTIEARTGPELAARVEWLEGPPTTAFDGVVLANEVLDALPVTRFRWQRNGCAELGVALAGEGFAWEARAAGESLAQACAERAQAGGGWEEGYVSEYCPRLPAWTQAITAAHRAGLALWIDYGLPRREYYLPERRDGTLICHFRQRTSEDPLALPGLQDISAWVDFTHLAEASAPAGYALAGFTTQAHFLAGLGIDRQMQRLASGEARAGARLAAEARRLLMPGEMGERFKAMAWLRGLELPLAGFALKDLRHTL